MIIVTGGRRTGTTLLANMICADDSAMPAVGEAQMVTRLLQVLRWARDPENFESFVRYAFPSEEELLAFFRGIIDEYVRRTRDIYGHGAKVVFKNPEYCLVFEELMQTAPDARFVVSVRDPRDQVASEIEVGVRLNEQEIRTSSPPARRDVVALARALNGYYEQVFASDSAGEERILFVRYRDMILDFARQSERIANFTGPDVSRFNPDAAWPRWIDKESLVPDYPTYSPLYGQPVDSSRIGRYRDVLTPQEIAWVERECADLMARFGYQPDKPVVTGENRQLEEAAGAFLAAFDVSLRTDRQDLEKMLAEIRRFRDSGALSPTSRSRMERLRKTVRGILDWQIDCQQWGEQRLH